METNDSELIQRYKEITSQVEERRKVAERAFGAFTHLKKELRDKFGYKSIKEAEKALKKMQADATRTKEVFIEKLTAFESSMEEFEDGL